MTGNELLTNYPLLKYVEFFRTPLFSLIILLYVSLISKRLFEGKISLYLSRALSGLGVSVFIYLLVGYNQVPSFISSIVRYFIVVLNISNFINVAIVFLEKYNLIFRSVFRGLFYAIAGIITSDWINNLYLPNKVYLYNLMLEKPGDISNVFIVLMDYSVITDLIFYVKYLFIFAAVISLSGVFETSDNFYLSFFSKRLNSKNFWKMSLLFIFTLYLSLRQIIIEIIMLNKQKIWMAEWGGISFVAFLIYRSETSFFRQELIEQEKSGKNVSHQTTIVDTTDSMYDETVRYVNEFIEEGKKQDLIVFLVNLFRHNGLSHKETREMVSELLNYENASPGDFMFSWQKDYYVEKNQKEREAIILRLEEMLEQV